MLCVCALVCVCDFSCVYVCACVCVRVCVCVYLLRLLGDNGGAHHPLAELDHAVLVRV